MIRSIAWLTLRECFRSSFPFVAAGSITLLALFSHLFQAFSFGAGETEAANLVVSAVFLASLVHASFHATATVRIDLERGTLGLLLSQPVTLAHYLLGRLTGHIASAAAISLAVALLLVGGFALPLGRVGTSPLLPQALAGWARALPPMLILEAAALAASALLPRVVGPFALFGFFLAGSLAEGPILGLLLPDFGVFGLEAATGVGSAVAFAYALAYVLFFLGLSHLAVACRSPLRSQT